MIWIQALQSSCMRIASLFGKETCPRPYTAATLGPPSRFPQNMYSCRYLSWQDLPSGGITAGTWPTDLRRWSAGNMNKVRTCLMRPHCNPSVTKNSNIYLQFWARPRVTTPLQSWLILGSCGLTTNWGTKAAGVQTEGWSRQSIIPEKNICKQRRPQGMKKMGYIDMMNHHSAIKAGKNAMGGLREETRHDHSKWGEGDREGY